MGYHKKEGIIGLSQNFRMQSSIMKGQILGSYLSLRFGLRILLDVSCIIDQRLMERPEYSVQSVRESVINSL